MKVTLERDHSTRSTTWTIFIALVFIRYDLLDGIARYQQYTEVAQQRHRRNLIRVTKRFTYCVSCHSHWDARV